MAGEGSKPKATIDDAYAYLRTVKNTFHNDRDKYDDFIAIMNNFKARKVDRKACIEEVKELLKGHRELISGFNAFLPKGLEIADWYNLEGQFYIMIRRSLKPALTKDDAMTYINAVKKAFRDEPAKYREFLNICNDFKANRIDIPTVIARMEVLMKYHLKLLLGFNTFLPPEAKIKIPSKAYKDLASKANKGLGRFEAMVGRSVPQNPTYDDARSYMNAVKEAFRDEPAKYREFLKLLDDYSRGVDANSVFARVEKLMKGHRNLLLGFSVFRPAAPDNNKRNTRSKFYHQD